MGVITSHWILESTYLLPLQTIGHNISKFFPKAFSLGILGIEELSMTIERWLVLGHLAGRSGPQNEKTPHHGSRDGALERFQSRVPMTSAADGEMPARRVQQELQRTVRELK